MFCGPKALGSTLHRMCNRYSEGKEDGTRFAWGKENVSLHPCLCSSLSNS